MSNFRFLTFFLKLLDFSRKLPLPKSGILGATDRKGCWKLSCRSGDAKMFLQKSYDPRKSRIFDFFVLVSMGRPGCGSFACISGYAQFFTQKVMLSKILFFNFLTAF